jgi:hypothetical protein
MIITIALLSHYRLALAISKEDVIIKRRIEFLSVLKLYEAFINLYKADIGRSFSVNVTWDRHFVNVPHAAESP